MAEKTASAIKKIAAAVREIFYCAIIAKNSHEVMILFWFNKLKAVADKFGYASDMKAYKAEPEKYKGNVSHIAEIIRVAVTGRKNTPDLWTIMQILGNDSCMKRLDKASEFLGR